MNDKSYKWSELSDKAIVKSIGRFIQKNRLLQNKTQEQIAEETGLSRSTLSLLERGENVRLDSLIQVLRVLNLLGLMQVFEIHDSISPIDYAKLKKKERKQASPRKEKTKAIEALEW